MSLLAVFNVTELLYFAGFLSGFIQAVLYHGK
jgi:hypothetical protein